MYFRARYFDTANGEFTRQDPLEYVDGMSLYRGYFIPSKMDPDGTDIWIEQNGFHRQICVHSWKFSQKTKKWEKNGKECFYFAVNVRNIRPRFEGVCCPGAVFLETEPNPTPQIVKWKKTTAREDVEFMLEILRHVGHEAAYNLFTRNCRHFAHDWFDRAPGKEIDIFK